MYNKYFPLKRSHPKIANMNMKNAWLTKRLEKRMYEENKLFKNVYHVDQLIRKPPSINKTYKKKLPDILR